MDDDAAAAPVEDQVLNGTFQFPDGARYVGSYLKKGDGSVFMHGEGRLLNGPETFLGTFEQGSFAKGKYVGAGGGIYEGRFLDQKFHGLGEYRWPDGRVYRGMWSCGRMHGRGQFENFSFGADKIFEGFSKEDEFHSNTEKQQLAKKEYIEAYGEPLLASAKQALKAMSEAAEFEGFVSFDPPNMPKKGVNPEEAPAAAPHPQHDQVTAAALASLVTGLEPAGEGEEPTTQVRLLEEAKSAAFIESKRLRAPQLQCVGQCIEFGSATTAKLALVNVRNSYDPTKADWRIAHFEAEPSGE